MRKSRLIIEKEKITIVCTIMNTASKGLFLHIFLILISLDFFTECPTCMSKSLYWPLNLLFLTYVSPNPYLFCCSLSGWYDTTSCLKQSPSNSIFLTPSHVSLNLLSMPTLTALNTALLTSHLVVLSTFLALLPLGLSPGDLELLGMLFQM